MNNVDIGKYKRIVQYLWDPEPKNDDEPGSPIWCLGREYQPLTPPQPQPPSPHVKAVDTGTKDAGDDKKTQDEQKNHLDQTTNTSPTRSSDSATKPQRHLLPFAIHRGSTTSPLGQQGQQHWPDAFLDDFESKIWLTYRSNFPLIPKSNDPNALSAMTLGVRLRSQLVDSQGFTTDTGWGCMIRSGQSLLANALAILSLGRACRALSSECEHAGLNVYVTSDGSDVYEDRFRAIASAGGTGAGTSTDVHPTLILLGIRLGIDRVTPVYWEALKAVLKYPQSVGIAGGRPSSSHYFIGAQGSHFFYLDPHHTRPALVYHDAGDRPYTTEELNTYHTRRLRRLHIKDMDPSMLIGFLIRDEDDWNSWKRSVHNRAMIGTGKAIIHVFDKEKSPFGGHGPEREGAVDEVEALDDDDDDDDDNIDVDKCDDHDARVDDDNDVSIREDAGDSSSFLHISK
ncbi:cysteine protease atg4 [Histoplasma capsulatum H143]|uniref:Cysteine protease n=1 Tax=Ajellomyces capsulatus (strain H143) TaxID=544712 RepID=C6HP71_AJECH|nr:cysteine protease atg4 [Histoplasma capsulatum H143]